MGRAPARCNQALLWTPAGGRYDEALLLLEQVSPAGGVAGGRGWRNCGGLGGNLAGGIRSYPVPLKLCSSGAGYLKRCWMTTL